MEPAGSTAELCRSGYLAALRACRAQVRIKVEVIRPSPDQRRRDMLRDMLQGGDMQFWVIRSSTHRRRALAPASAAIGAVNGRWGPMGPGGR